MFYSQTNPCDGLILTHLIDCGIHQIIFVRQNSLGFWSFKMKNDQIKKKIFRFTDLVTNSHLLCVQWLVDGSDYLDKFLLCNTSMHLRHYFSHHQHNQNYNHQFFSLIVAKVVPLEYSVMESDLTANHLKLRWKWWQTCLAMIYK